MEHSILFIVASPSDVWVIKHFGYRTPSSNKSLGYMLKELHSPEWQCFWTAFPTCTYPCTHAGTKGSKLWSEYQQKDEISVSENRRITAATTASGVLLFAGEKPEFTKRNLGWWRGRKTGIWLLIVDQCQPLLVPERPAGCCTVTTWQCAEWIICEQEERQFQRC